MGIQYFNYLASRHSVTDKVYHVSRGTRYAQPYSPAHRLTDFVSTPHPNDTPLAIGGYLAGIVRFSLAKDGTWIDDFTCCPRDRHRR